MNESNARISASDDVRKICRSCLCRGDKLIPLDVPYNSVINAKYEYVDARETIAKLMMACGNVQVTRITIYRLLSVLYLAIAKI